MAGTIKIRMDPGLVDALERRGKLVIRLVAPGTPAAGAARLVREPGERTHMGRLISWARKLGEPFRTRRAAQALGLNVRHTSVLLVHAVQNGYGLARLSHGVYVYRG